MSNSKTSISDMLIGEPSFENPYRMTPREMQENSDRMERIMDQMSSTSSTYIDPLAQNQSITAGNSMQLEYEDLMKVQRDISNQRREQNDYYYRQPEQTFQQKLGSWLSKFPKVNEWIEKEDVTPENIEERVLELLFYAIQNQHLTGNKAIDDINNEIRRMKHK